MIRYYSCFQVQYGKKVVFDFCDFGANFSFRFESYAGLYEGKDYNLVFMPESRLGSKAYFTQC